MLVADENLARYPALLPEDVTVPDPVPAPISLLTSAPVLYVTKPLVSILRNLSVSAAPFVIPFSSIVSLNVPRPDEPSNFKAVVTPLSTFKLIVLTAVKSNAPAPLSVKVVALLPSPEIDREPNMLWDAINLIAIFYLSV